MQEQNKAWSQFHTPPELALQLANLLSEAPHNLVDLGCGPGALARAAIKVWGSDVRLTTVDIDPKAGPSAGNWADFHEHLTIDLLGTDSLLHKLPAGKFDAAILNPPYGRISSPVNVCERRPNRAATDALMHPSSVTRCRATGFVLHALRAVRVGGQVAAILPETLAQGVLAASNRMLITMFSRTLDAFTVPERSFTGTEARVVLVLLERCLPRKGETRQWIAVPKQRQGPKPLEALSDLGVEIVRGRLSSADARRMRAFHLDGFASVCGGEIRFEDHAAVPRQERAAMPGDILVARIGRGIPDKIARVADGSNAISDCVFRLRCPPSTRERVWLGLRSSFGKKQIEAALSGVTTRVLPLSALKSLRV